MTEWTIEREFGQITGLGLHSSHGLKKRRTTK